MISKRYWQTSNIEISKVCKCIDDHIEFWEAVNYLLRLIDLFDYKCEYPYVQIVERIKWSRVSDDIMEKYLKDFKTHLKLKEELKIFDIIYG